MKVLLVTLVLLASVAVQAQAPTFERGQVVRLRPSTSRPTTILLRVVAIPNDRIRGADSMLYVNDVAVTGFSPDFLTRVSQTSARTIPEGHYFVMGERRVNDDISEHTGLHPAEELERVP